MTLPKIPTFDELLKRAKQPRITTPSLDDELDSSMATRLGYKIPPEWKLGRDIAGVSLISPRGNIFKDIKLSPEGRIEDFKPFSAEGKPIELPLKVGREPLRPPAITPTPAVAEPAKGLRPPPPVKSLQEREQRASAFRAYRQAGGELLADQWELSGMPPPPEITEKDLTRHLSAKQILLGREKGWTPEETLSRFGIEKILPEPRKGAGFILDILSGRKTTENPEGLNLIQYSAQYPAAEAAMVYIPTAVIVGYTTFQLATLAWNAFLEASISRAFQSRAAELGQVFTKDQAAVAAKQVVGGSFRVARGAPPATQELVIRFSKKWLSIQALKQMFRLDGGSYKLGDAALALEATNEATSVVNSTITALIPQVARTGLAMGGEQFIPAIADIVTKIISRTDLTPVEEQFRANNAQAVEDELIVRAGGQPTPAVTPEVTEAFTDINAYGLVDKHLGDQGHIEYTATIIGGEKSFTEIARAMASSEAFQIELRQTLRDIGLTEQITVYRGGEEGRISGEYTNVTLNPNVAKRFGIVKTYQANLDDVIGIGKVNESELLFRTSALKEVIPEVARPPAEVAPEAPERVTRPVTEEVVPTRAEIAKQAEQLRVKLEAEPPVVKPAPKLPVERRAEIQTLLKEPAKNLPTGTTKITLRKELAQINKSLIPQEKALRSQIMASVKSKSIGITQSRNIFREVGGSRYLTNLELTQLEKVLKAVQKARPIRIKGKLVITPKKEALIQASKKDLISQGILTEARYKEILESLKLNTDKYIDPQKFITNAQGSDIIRAMRNMAILNPLGELRFGKPTALKYLTSQTYYAQVLGLKPLTNPLELAKVDFDLANRAMANAVDQKLRDVNKAWGVSLKEQVSAKAKNIPTKGSSSLRDLLDKYEEPPASLTDEQKELFSWFRNLNRSIIDGENEVRRAMGIEEITYRQAYVRHIPDAMARDIIEGRHPLPQSLLYWSKRLVSKKIFNPMELHRQLSEDLEKLYSKDLAFATKGMVYTGLKEIHLAQPLRTFTEQMGALSDVMPATTRKWVTDYINQVIKGQQTEFDESINAMVTESGIGGLIDRALRPFNRTLGNRPVTNLTTTIGNATIYAVLGAPRPRLLRLMLRNMFQRTQELAFHGVMPTLKSFLPDPQELKVLKGESRYLRSYTGIEEFPTDLLSKLKKVPLAPYQFTATLNADRGMSTAYHDFIKFFEDKKYKDLGWASEQRTYTEEKGFLYPEEQKLMLEEMELATRAAQYQYIGMGMPEIFRHKTLIPITRLQSWWMNHFTMFHREAFYRFATGETRGGQKLPWSRRLNYLWYLLFGGAILTAMGYGASFGVKVLPHNESPFMQFAVGLAKYVSAGSDWERVQAKRSMYYSWKAIVPGALAYDEFEKLWTGEMPLWQMFFYGSKEEGAPPRIPDWSLPIPTAKEARPRIANLMSMLGGFDQAELDARLKVATDAEVSPARIREIKAQEYLYDITSMRRDMADVVLNLSEKDIAKLEPIVGNYVEFKVQDKEYSLLSDAEQEQYIKDNPKYTTNRLFWGDNGLVTIPDLKTAESLDRQANEFKVPLNMIPAFQSTDKGQERIPSDRNLWDSYFTYYDLPGSGGYLSLSQSAVDDGRLPEEYRQIWETYQRLKTDFAKTAYRKKYKKLTVNLREELRRANPEFDKWLVDQEYNKPLSPVTVRRPTRAAPTTPSAFGGFRAPSPRGAAPTYPTFPKPKISTGAIRAPRVPRV